ncbi:MAG: hypothetical protein OEY06_12220 [Gammaproteobacteria bacterium]|nr:hypothetical protein [Gammaproteobacteria bacterium]
MEITEEYKWESPSPLRDEVVGRVAAGSGLFIAAGCISFAMNYIYIGMIFIVCAIIAGYYFYKKTNNTTISISNGILRYGKSTEVVLERIESVSVKRQFMLTDVLVIKISESLVGGIIPLHGVPTDVRNKLIDIIQSKIKNS